MKRLITIFLTTMTGIFLYGQKVPMTVVGPMYIDTQGKVESVGSVHLKALDANSIAKVENHGYLTVLDSIIFYTDDFYDGLLMNQNPADDAVVPTQVVVRKHFMDSVLQYSEPIHIYANDWRQISFPFDVEIVKVSNSLDKTVLTNRGTGDYSQFDFQQYDAQNRADIGQNVDANWVALTAPNLVYLTRGTGYRFYVDPQFMTTRDIDGSGWVDFPAYPGSYPSGFTKLFSPAAKGFNLTYKQSPVGKFVDPDKSEGWNIIGGLNTSNYVISYQPGSQTITWDRTIWYRDVWGGAYKPIFPVDVAHLGTLRPYGVINVQTDATSILPYSPGVTPPNNPAGFEYRGSINGGLTLGVIAGAPLFRSAEAATLPYDVIKVQFAGGVNSTVAPVYFRINSSYNQSYHSSKDDILVSLVSDPKDPSIWAIAEPYQLFVNGISTGVSDIPLGVIFPSSGDYVFSLKDVFINSQSPVKSAILEDKVAKEKTELLNGGKYTFSYTNLKVNKTDTISDRFILHINPSSTSIDAVPTSGIYAYADNNILTVKNLLVGDKVQVWDVTGRTIAFGVASGDTYSVTLHQRGVYIVNVRGNKTLKVLNK